MKQETASYLCYAILIAVAACRYFEGSITIGVVAASLAAFIALQNPLEIIFQTVSTGTAALAALSRIVDLSRLASPPALRQLPALPARYDVEFRKVHFMHAAGSNAVIRNVNLDLGAGQKIGIVGRSGSGKTTIAELLLRLLTPDSGSIHIGGIDISQLSNEQMRDLISFVPQDPFIFNGSLRQNISLDRTDIDDATLLDILDIVGLKGFVDDLAEGLDTHLGINGRLVSGGEKQRIGIARAMVVDPPIIVLDEATSALDPLIQHDVMNSLYDRLADHSVFIITHRLETLDRCDRVLVIDDGAVIQDGTPGDLRAIPGAYRAMSLIGTKS